MFASTNIMSLELGGDDTKGILPVGVRCKWKQNLSILSYKKQRGRDQ